MPGLVEYGMVRPYSSGNKGAECLMTHSGFEQGTMMTDHIGIYDEAIDSRFCEQCITMFENSNHVTRGRFGGGERQDIKDSEDICISMHPEWQPVVSQLMVSLSSHLARYVRQYCYLLFCNMGSEYTDDNGKSAVLTPENLANLPERGMGALIQSNFRPTVFNMQKYCKGQGGYHRWHSEIYPGEPNCETLHRVLFFIYYLNDVSDGGETLFYYQNRAVEPRQGRLIIAPAGFTHTHKGEIPLSNDKYIITSWIMYHRYESLVEQGGPL